MWQRENKWEMVDLNSSISITTVNILKWTNTPIKRQRLTDLLGM